MKDLKIPFAIVSFLLVQGAGAVWWASQVDGRVKNLETQSLNIAKENRRYIKEVVMPSYNISDGWKNPYYEDCHEPVSLYNLLSCIFYILDLLLLNMIEIHEGLCHCDLGLLCTQL